MYPILETFVSNPIYWILLFVVSYAVTSYARAPTAADLKPPPVAVPEEPIVLRDFTREELSKFNGENGAKIYLAIKGKVFDVTRSAHFYGPKGAYGIFAGKDASRGMALNDTDESVLVSPTKEKDDLSDLKPDEIESLQHWLEFFESKYTHVGSLV